jgi:RimJ/RimL family protein N-acetyltransferase
MIATARLVLRAYRAGDVSALVELLGDFEVARWLARVPHPYTRQDAAQWIELSRDQERRSFAITREGMLVGGIGLGMRPDGVRELGYWVGRPYQRNGYAEEAARAVLRFAFTELGEARVLVSALPDNAPSLHLIAKLGFRSIGLHPFYAKPLRPWPARIPYFELRPHQLR